MKLLFEPWNLGDALIAASVAATAPDKMILACHSRWHELLRLASGGSLRLAALDLPYVWRTHRGWYTPAAFTEIPGLPSAPDELEVISIRGDLRDWLSARHCLKGACFRFSGWLPYLARWIAPLDLPFRYGLLPVRNRYRAWAKAAGVPFEALEKAAGERAGRPVPGNVVVHVGAQWRSKQYPHVAQLVRLVEERGLRVSVLAGPEDPLPPGLPSGRVARPGWSELVQALREAEFVVTNDSGPLHLAAFLGCRTLALSRCSNIAEWLPPGARSLSSKEAPRGYSPARRYWSDTVLTGWPSAETVLEALQN